MHHTFETVPSFRHVLCINIEENILKTTQVSPCFDGPLVLVGRDAVDGRDGGAGGSGHRPRGHDRPLRGGGRNSLDRRLRSPEIESSRYRIWNYYLILLGHGSGRPLGCPGVGVGVLVGRNLAVSPDGDEDGVTDLLSDLTSRLEDLELIDLDDLLGRLLFAVAGIPLKPDDGERWELVVLD